MSPQMTDHRSHPLIRINHRGITKILFGFGNVEMNEEYDSWTRHAIEEIQAKYGIPVDGFVGPLTKIILYREKNSFEMPYLTR